MWQKITWESCHLPFLIIIITSRPHQFLKRGQGSSEVIYSSRRIRRASVCDWHVFICTSYLYSPLYSILDLLSLSGQQHASPWQYVRFSFQKDTKKKVWLFYHLLFELPRCYLSLVAIKSGLFSGTCFILSPNLTCPLVRLVLCRPVYLLKAYPKGEQRVPSIPYHSTFGHPSVWGTKRVVLLKNIVTRYHSLTGVSFNWGVMAVLRYLVQEAAAGAGDSAKEIDFVPYILSL